MIRIVSINTWQGRGPYRARMVALAEQLVELRPDIIAMQEALVATDGSANTTAMVASLLGMHAIFHPQRQAEEAIEGRDTPLMWGLAILSRWPIADVHVVQTPPDPDDGDRPALLGAVQSPWGAIRVVCLHLTHMRNTLIRERQLQAVAAAGWLHEPAIGRLLCGDFNQVPAGPEMRRLFAGDDHSWHVLDTFTAGGGDPDRVTFSHRNGHVAHIPGQHCLDYILSLAPSADAHPRFADSAVVLDRPSAAGVFPSDHFGVATTLDPAGLPATAPPGGIVGDWTGVERG